MKNILPAIILLLSAYSSSAQVGINTSTPNADLEVNGYTMLGSDAPKIKVKLLTGTTSASQGGIVPILHGLNAAKILSVSVIINTPQGYIPHPKYVSFDFEYYFDANNVYIRTISPTLISKPFKVLITYEQ